MRSRVRVLNGALDPLTQDAAVAEAFRAIDGGRRGWICTVNVSTLMAMRKSPRLQRFVDDAMLSVADGQPLVWCAPIFGGKVPERVAGIDLMDALCARAATAGRSVYLLGATARVLELALHAMRARHPGLMIDGSDGYFSDAQGERRAEMIRSSGASLLFVGMGTPRQESFIATHWTGLGVAVAVPVGGSFDVVGGVVMRAPLWARRAGLEWVFRMCQEPKRLLPRYLVTNTRFCLLIVAAAWGRLRR